MARSTSLYGKLRLSLPYLSRHLKELAPVTIETQSKKKESHLNKSFPFFRQSANIKPLRSTVKHIARYPLYTLRQISFKLHFQARQEGYEANETALF